MPTSETDTTRHEAGRAHMDWDWNVVYVDRVRRFSLDIEENSGRMFVAIAVSNGMAEYDEWYEVDAQDFERYRSDPTLAHAFVDRCKRRELDHLLLLPPGKDRGSP